MKNRPLGPRPPNKEIVDVRLKREEPKLLNTRGPSCICVSQVEAEDQPANFGMGRET